MAAVTTMLQLKSNESQQSNLEIKDAPVEGVFT